MYGVIGIERSTDQQRLVVIFKDCFRTLDLKTGAITSTDPGTVLSERDRQSSPSLIYGKVIRHYKVGQKHLLLHASLTPLKSVIFPDGLKIDQFFAGKKISFGRTQDGKLAVWNSVTDEVNVTRHDFPKYAEFRGNPDQGTFSFMVEPFEHRPPISIVFNGTKLISYDSHFIFDIKGDQVLRSFAQPHGIDVYPEELYAARLPDKLKLWSHTKNDPDTQVAFWINNNIIAKSGGEWQLLTGRNGKVQAKLPFLNAAKYVTTVENYVIAYYPATSQMVAYSKNPQTQKANTQK